MTNLEDKITLGILVAMTICGIFITGCLVAHTWNVLS